MLSGMQLLMFQGQSAFMLEGQAAQEELLRLIYLEHADTTSP
jgi:hypothetical protein